MAARNMEKVAQGIKVPSRYQMVVSEMDRLHALIKTGKEFEAIKMAFDYGFALGCRATKRQPKKRLPNTL